MINPEKVINFLVEKHIRPAVASILSGQVDFDDAELYFRITLGDDRDPNDSTFVCAMGGKINLDTPEYYEDEVVIDEQGNEYDLDGELDPDDGDETYTISSKPDALAEGGSAD